MAPPRATRNHDLLNLAPVPTLLKRISSELAGDFSRDLPVRVSRAPGRLDVMGGIADYTGSMVCEGTLDRAAAVVLQGRSDRLVKVFSLNLLDEHQPYSFEIPLDALAANSIATLRDEFQASGHRWAGYIAGCLAILHEQGIVDLHSPKIRGMNIALLSDVPFGSGVSSSAAIEIATMLNILDHLDLPREPMLSAVLCQQVENRVVGAPCGIMDQVSSCAGESGRLLRMICQPHELLPPLLLPAGIRVVGINSNVKHSVGGGMYGKTRCAAFMGHRIILQTMRDMGKAHGSTLTSDPMKGYLANLDPEDYKRLFRPLIPQQMDGAAFLAQYGSTIDTATTVDPKVNYHIQQATDHHVLEARRVKNFVGHLESAAALAKDFSQRKLALDKAGHLMYASHLSYTNDALLGADECDLLVDLARKRESAGLYGAKITGGGSGGTVAVLADISTSADSAIAAIMIEYEKRTSRRPQSFLGDSPGAWEVGTVVCNISRS